MPVTQQMIEKAVLLAREYGAKKLVLFGSALNDQGAARDLDLACDGIDGWKLFEFGGRLEDQLHIPVDVVPLDPPTRFSRYIELHGKILL